MGDNAKNENKQSRWIGLKSEFDNITWPDRTTLLKQGIAVTAVSVVLGCIIAVLDLAIQYGVNFLTM